MYELVQEVAYSISELYTVPTILNKEKCEPLSFDNTEYISAGVGKNNTIFIVE